MSYCDICGYPAPCGREHYWLEQEQLWETANLREAAANRSAVAAARKRRRARAAGRRSPQLPAAQDSREDLPL